MSSLLDLQSEIVDAIDKSSTLMQRGLVCVAEDKGNIVATLDAMQAKLGVCAVVSTPGFRNETESGNPLGDATISISVLENVVLNRVKPGYLTATEAAESVASLLHLSLDLGLRFESMDPLPLNGGVTGYELSFKKRIALKGE